MILVRSKLRVSLGLMSKYLLLFEEWAEVEPPLVPHPQMGPNAEHVLIDMNRARVE